MQTSKTPTLLLVHSLACLTLIGFAVLRSDHAWTTASSHPDIAAMEIGGQRAIDDARLWPIGLALGLAMISMLTVTLNLATTDTASPRQLRTAILVGGVFYIAVFVAMMFSQRELSADATPAVSGPFPAPTNWLVFGIWFTPVIFTAIYVLGFNTWFAADDDEQADATQVDGKAN